jgi:hypothetical protein
MSTQTLTREQREDLAEFVEQVNQLQSSRFGQRVLLQRSVTLRSTAGDEEPELVNFDEEECRSFLLGCRMLMQNNDRVSIGKVWTLFKDTIGDPAWFVRVNPPRWMLNDYLDQEMMFADPTGEVTTNRQLVDTFLFGSYAHLNRAHRARFKAWQSDPQFHSLKLLFLLGLKVILEMAGRMADAVEDYLVEEPTGTEQDGAGQPATRSESK